MTEAKLFMVAVDKNPTEAASIARDVAKRIESKEIKLLDVVKSLGEPLTDEDRTMRAKAIAYLSSVLAYIDVSSLSRQHITVLVEFMCERVDDEVAIKEICNGLIALQGMSRFSKEDAQLTARTITRKVDMKKHSQGTRFIALSLIDKLMSNHRGALKNMGDDFITAFTDFVAGEKDPRNLMIVFSLWRVILVEFDILKHTEEVFDAIYCYFPITFRPPPDDPYGITTQDLKERLRDCLCSTHYFAKQLFPNLIDKLDSTNVNVKRDALQTMATASNKFGPSTMKKHYQKMWDAIKYEITNAMPSDGDDVVADALTALRAIAVSLSHGLSSLPDKTTPLAEYIKSVTNDLRDTLAEPQKKEAKAAISIIAKIATAGPAAHGAIIAGILPALMTVYQDAEEVAKRKAWMELMLELLKATLDVYGVKGTMDPLPTMENPLLKFRDSLFENYSQALMGSGGSETSMRLIALQALSVMSRIREFLNDADVKVVVLYFDEIVLKEEREELRKEALQGLLEISKFKEQLITETTFPVLMAALPDKDEKEQETDELVLEETKSKPQPYPVILEALAMLSFEDVHFKVLSTRLLNKLNVLIQSGASATYVQTLLTTLLTVLEKKCVAGHPGVNALLKRIVASLIAKTVYPLVLSKEQTTVMVEDGVMGVTARLSNLLIRSLPVEEQRDVFQLFLDIWWRTDAEADFDKLAQDPLLYFGFETDGGNETTLEEGRKLLKKEFNPFSSGEDDTLHAERKAASAVIFVCAYAGLRRENTFPALLGSELKDGDIAATTLAVCISKALNPLSAVARQNALLLAALIVNKDIPSIDKSPHIKSFIEELLSNPQPSANVLVGVNLTLNQNSLSENRLRLLFWLAKALLLKGDKYASNNLLGQLIDMLGSESQGLLAARGFAVLLEENQFLNSENFAVVNGLWKQRVFAISVPRIVDGFKSADDAVKPNYLIALSHILRTLPSPIILPELPTIFPLLLQSLDLRSSPEVKSATTTTLYITILESPSLVRDHLTSLITRLLSSASGREGNPPRVRAAALRCLGVFPVAMKTEDLHQFKKKVIKGLIPVLDDPKRGVRKEAVECRARWFGVEEEDDD